MKVLVFSDRSSFRSGAKEAFQEAGWEIVLKPCLDASVATWEQSQGDAALLDGSSAVYRDDYEELLTAAGLLRAQGILVASFVPSRACSPVDEDLLAELCQGLIYREDAELSIASRAMKRRVDPKRLQTAEFATVTAEHRALLLVLSSGRSLLCPRPLCAEDTGAISSLALSQDSTELLIELESGRLLPIKVEDLLSRFGRHRSPLPKSRWSEYREVTSPSPSQQEPSSDQKPEPTKVVDRGLHVYSREDGEAEVTSRGISSAEVSTSGIRRKSLTPERRWSSFLSETPEKNKEPFSPKSQELGSRIRLLRLEAGITQEELARRVGISRHQVASLENGNKPVSWQVVDEISKAFGERGRTWLREFRIYRSA